MEEWRDIPGFEGRYQASTLGRVRSVDRVVYGVSKAGRPYPRRVKGVVLAPGWCRGYLIVNLPPKGTIAVHLLVGRTFLGPPPVPGAEVNHRDGIKAHNELANLEWLTTKQNHGHAVDMGLRPQCIGVTNGVKTWPSISRAAEELSGSKKNGQRITEYLRGDREIALGHHWSRV